MTTCGVWDLGCGQGGLILGPVSPKGPPQLLIKLVSVLGDHVAMCPTATGSLPVGVVVVLVILVAAMIILAGVIIYRKAPRRIQRRSVAPKPTTGLSNPLFYMGDNSLTDKNRLPGPPEVVSTNKPPRPTVTPKRPPPAPTAATSSPPLPVPVYTQQVPNLLRPVPPNKPLQKLNPKQVKPNFAPPTPPVKPGSGGTVPGVTQRAGGPTDALKVPFQKR